MLPLLPTRDPGARRVALAVLLGYLMLWSLYYA